MNEITLNKTEQLLKDGYKLIYPNNFGLNLSMKSNEHITNNNIIYKIGIAFDGFRIIEGLEIEINCFYQIEFIMKYINWKMTIIEIEIH